MVILADNQNSRNFDQMLDDQNKRMVTHFITRAAMCATVNSLSTLSNVLKLWFNPKVDASELKRVLYDGFEYAYYQNVAVFYTVVCLF